MEDRSGVNRLDLGRLTERLMLAAHARGLGSGLATFQGDEPQREAARVLGIPAGYVAPLAIGVGYAARDQGPPSSTRPRGRKPLSEIVHYERFGQIDPGE